MTRRLTFAARGPLYGPERESFTRCGKCMSGRIAVLDRFSFLCRRRASARRSAGLKAGRYTEMKCALAARSAAKRAAPDQPRALHRILSRTVGISRAALLA